ncbi:hypothetical protein ACTA71_009385 [Dictyostelium dimigraforme]
MLLQFICSTTRRKPQKGLLEPFSQYDELIQSCWNVHHQKIQQLVVYHYELRGNVNGALTSGSFFDNDPGELAERDKIITVNIIGIGSIVFIETSAHPVFLHILVSLSCLSLSYSSSILSSASSLGNSGSASSSGGSSSSSNSSSVSSSISSSGSGSPSSSSSSGSTSSSSSLFKLEPYIRRSQTKTSTTTPKPTKFFNLKFITENGNADNEKTKINKITSKTIKTKPLSKTERATNNNKKQHQQKQQKRHKNQRNQYHYQLQQLQQIQFNQHQHQSTSINILESGIIGIYINRNTGITFSNHTIQFFIFLNSIKCRITKCGIDKWECSENVEHFSLLNGTEISISLNASNDGHSFDIDMASFIYKNMLCDDLFNKFIPEIPSFPVVPTTGGNVGFVYNFPCGYLFNNIKPIFFGTSRFVPKFDPNSNLFNMTMPPGCGIINFDYNILGYNFNILNTTYQAGSIKEVGIDGEGNFIIQGSNLFNTLIKIKGDRVANDSPVGNIGITHSNVTFKIPESRYQGDWIIDVKICNSHYDSFGFKIRPTLNEFKGGLNKNGGHAIFAGNYLRSRSKVTATFGNRFINCSSTGSSKNVACNIPSFNDFGSTGINISLSVTIDSRFITNTIKLSYNL